MTVAEAIYLLSAATCLVAAAMLLRQYRRRRAPLLLWSFIAFIGLSINNVLVYVDLVLVTDADLSTPRAAAGAIAMLVLVYGLIWEGSS
jgi:hypothetical protein